MFGVACLLFVMLYIEYRFKELAHQIEQHANRNLSRTYLDLKLLIIKHRHLIKLTEKMNKLFRFDYVITKLITHKLNTLKVFKATNLWLKEEYII